MRHAALALCVCAIATRPALAQDDPAAQPAPPESKPGVEPESKPGVALEVKPEIKPGVLPSLAAAVPGLLVPGIGHYIAGDRDTAWRLLKLRGLAFGVMLLSGGAFLATTGSRYVARPTLPILVGSASVFFTGWGADIYGASGGAQVSGVTATDVATLEARLGYVHIIDPRFDYASFTDVGADFRIASWRASARAQLAVPDSNQRVHVSAGYRATGPKPGRPGRDGSFVEFQAGATYHRYGDDGFSVTSAEAAAFGRYDLARLSPALRGSFAELSLGLGVDVTTYPATGAPADIHDLLIGGFAYGMYLGGRGMSGEIKLFYDHRRGGFIGGAALPNGLSGYVGSIGADARLLFTPRWGVLINVQAGSAYLLGASLLYRQ